MDLKKRKISVLKHVLEGLEHQLRIIDGATHDTDQFPEVVITSIDLAIKITENQIKILENTQLTPEKKKKQLKNQKNK